MSDTPESESHRDRTHRRWLRASGLTVSLRPGGLLALDQGVRHDIDALEESAFLLTIAWPGRE